MTLGIDKSMEVSSQGLFDILKNKCIMQKTMCEYFNLFGGIITRLKHKNNIET